MEQHSGLSEQIQTLSVDLGERSYPIYIGDDVLANAERCAQMLRPCIRGRQAVLVTNQTVRDLYAQRVQAALSDVAVDVFVMGDGEQYKSLQTYTAAMDFLMSKRHNRTMPS